MDFLTGPSAGLGIGCSPHHSIDLDSMTPTPLLTRDSRLESHFANDAPLAGPELPLSLPLDSLLLPGGLNVAMDAQGGVQAATEHDAGVRRDRPWLYASVRTPPA